MIYDMSSEIGYISTMYFRSRLFVSSQLNVFGDKDERAVR